MRSEYTVEIYGKPVEGDDWSAWRRATDVVPGTILLEDPTEPCLVIPVDAGSVSDAAVIAQGVMGALGLGIAWGRVYRTEPGDHVHTPGSSVVTPDFVPPWVEDAAKTERVRSTV